MDSSSSVNKKEQYEKVIQIHLEKGPVEHNYSFGFLCELFNDLAETPDHSLVVYTHAPVNICGDLRSRFGDLLDIFGKCGWPFDTKYIFLGNYADGAKFSIETLVLLFCCKLCYPEKFILIRGCLENMLIENENSFLGELRVKFPDGNQWRFLTHMIKKIYSKLPLCVILNKKIICVNSSFSTSVKNEENSVVIKNGCVLGNRSSSIEVKFLEMDETTSATTKKKDERSKAVKTLLQSVDMVLMINSNCVTDIGYMFSNQNMVLTLMTGAKVSDVSNNRGVVMMMDQYKNVHFKKINGIDQFETEEKNLLLRQRQ